MYEERTKTPFFQILQNIIYGAKEFSNLTIQLCTDSDYIITLFYIFGVSVIIALTFKKIGCVGTVRLYLHTKFHVPASNVSIGITIKLKINYTFCANAEL